MSSTHALAGNELDVDPDVFARPASRATPWVTLSLLTLAYAANMADRSIISAVAAPIQQEFQLSDTMLGVLTGTTIAIFFVFASLPLGYVADRVNRRNMVVVCLSLFGSMTALCGMAGSLGLLLLARFGVGIGETAATPASLALLSDSFSARNRAFAMSVFTLGIPIGIAAGLRGASLLIGEFGWRGTLIIFGALTMLIALPLLLLREPKRVRDNSVQERPSFMGAVKQMLQNRPLRSFLLANVLGTLWLWGALLWLPLYLTRRFGLSVQEVGERLSVVHGIGGAAAMVLTVGIVHWVTRYHARYQVYFLAILFFLALVPTALLFLTPSLSLCMLLCWVLVGVAYAYNGPGFAICASLVPPNIRAQAIACCTLSGAIGNYLIAPLLIGACSDLLIGQGVTADRALGTALASLPALGLLSVWLLLRCARHYASAADED